ncbi:L,D-transpeptidase family protein [Allosphingosinicella flava]|uniref:L,D-transpeptidase family protein n=1 Tax=Allosphingosinicella flava TaxID=2771430 RepID=A0A7T2GJP9_9SPHN|nr:L,D-transpeptidase family protein [Sphingosinicella flava]QPQ55125.1 L,D-transpeptidase family protein [Sphingosinicella flava]
MKNSIRSLLATAALAGFAAPSLAQLQEGEKPTEEQVKAGEAPATRTFEGELAIRSLQNPVMAPLWTREAAQELLAYVEGVGQEGLTPADYAPDALRAALSGTDEMALRTAATDSFLRLSSDLALGHVRGKGRIDWHMQDPDLDGNKQYALMESAVRDNKVRATLDGLLPTHPQYAELKEVLAVTTDKAVADKARANLERWRWLPRDLGPRYVIVNVPAFTAAIVENGQVTARHRAVVGAVKTKTPQLSAVATGVIFNPWWEVPASITPEVRGKAGYVAVKAGNGVRYRQPPGPGNALGRMKVVMPNNYAIYLHDTPSKQYFSRAARALSHGCIRTQDALGFARKLLDNPEWSQEKINRTIASGKTAQAKTRVDTPVYIAYFTAAAAKDKGGIISYDDVYGRDKTVIAGLNDKAGNSMAAAASK